MSSMNKINVEVLQFLNETVCFFHLYFCNQHTSRTKLLVPRQFKVADNCHGPT